MISGGLVLNIYTLFRAVWHGVKYDEGFRSLLLVLVTLLIGSTYFFWKVEGWSAIDALYFSVMTMSTIGYGDFVPTTTASKIFTIVFSFLSIGVYVAVVTKIVTIVMAEKKLKKSRKLKKKEQKKQQTAEEVNAQSKSHHPESAHPSAKDNGPE